MTQYSVVVDQATGIGTIVIDDDLDFRSLSEALLQLWHDDDFRARILFDARKGGLANLKPPAIRRAAEGFAAIRPDLPRGRGAYLVARDVDYGVARMIEVLAEVIPSESRTFRDYDAAWSWLLQGTTD